jgi:hypothetical protein
MIYPVIFYKHKGYYAILHEVLDPGRLFTLRTARVKDDDKLQYIRIDHENITTVEGPFVLVNDLGAFYPLDRWPLPEDSEAISVIDVANGAPLKLPLSRVVTVDLPN